MMSHFNIRSLVLICVVGTTTASTASAQFGNSGIFGDLLNQALPRIGVNSNQPGMQGYPGVPSNVPMGVPTNYSATTTNNNFGFNTSLAPGQISGRPRDWTLGVALDNLDTGAIVRQISPNSPAQRAGIEQGDMIVAIGGAQVGLVNGRLNDVGEQIRRSADVNGLVRALVLDARSSRLQNMDINLTSASVGVVGMAATRDRANLPYGSILRVRLENASRQFAEVNGGETALQVYGPGPYSFEMNYDPRYINPNDQYRLNATITDANGQPIYALRQPIPVPPTGLPNNIRLELESFRDLQMSNGGNVVQASYPGDPNIVNQVFQQLLGKIPSAKEQVAWSSYLAQGNSLNDLKAKIISSPNYYDRMGNVPSVFIQSMIETLKGKQASAQEIAAWTNRLQQYNGQREELVREFIQQLR